MQTPAGDHQQRLLMFERNNVHITTKVMKILSGLIGKLLQVNQKQSHIPTASMGLVYIYLHLVDFYGIPVYHVGKHTIAPCIRHGIQSDTWNRPP